MDHLISLFFRSIFVDNMIFFFFFHRSRGLSPSNQSAGARLPY